MPIRIALGGAESNPNFWRPGVVPIVMEIDRPGRSDPNILLSFHKKQAGEIERAGPRVEGQSQVFEPKSGQISSLLQINRRNNLPKTPEASNGL